MSKGTLVTPISIVQDTGINTPACKHFFPCSGLVNTINLIDVKNGVTIQPQNGANFIVNTSEKSILPNCNGTNTFPPATLVSGSWNVLPSGYSALLVTAGYIDSTYAPNKTIRTAIGDNNQLLGLSSFQGWGLSDGIAASGLYQHNAFGGNLYDSDGNSFSGCVSTSGNSTGNILSQNTFFIRYSLYKPGIQLESKILISDGSVSINDATLYGPGAGALTQNGATFVNAFRMHGYRCIGLAIFYFSSTVPSDYLNAIKWMGFSWKNNNRYIYPGWRGLN